MKTKLILINFIVLSINFQLIGQIPDGGFNNWTTNSIGRLDLQEWITNNLNFSAPTLVQDLGQSGSGFSAKFTSVYDSSVGYYQGGFVQLVLVPFTGSMRPNALLGYWKTYNPSNSDIILGDVQLYNSSLVEIGSGAKQTPFSGSLPSWTPFSMPITYTTSDSVAFFSIRISWTNFGGNPAGYSQIDDIHFDISTDENESPDRKTDIKISEVKNGYFELSCPSSTWDNLTIQVYDMGGKQILTQKPAIENDLHSPIALDLSHLSSGIYFCKVFNKSRIKTFKLLVN